MGATRFSSTYAIHLPSLAYLISLVAGFSLLAWGPGCGRVSYSRLDGAPPDAEPSDADPRDGESADGGRLDWLDDAWPSRQRITVLPMSIGAPLTGFVVYVNLADLAPSFHDEVLAGGEDIRLTDSTGVNELAREVVGLDRAAGTGELYFRADTLSPDEETSFYLYYGNALATEPPAASSTGSQGVWTNGFVGAWHLEERPDFDDGCGLDRACNSGSEAHPGIISDGFESSAQGPGLLGGALSFDGDGDAVDMPSLSNAGFPQRAGTLSILFNFQCMVDSPNTDFLFDAFTRARRHFFLRCTIDLPGTNFQMAVATGFDMVSYEFASSFLLTDDDWDIVTITYDTDLDEVAVYQNGAVVSAGSLSAAWLPADQFFVLGRDNAGSPIGLIDEVRMSNVQRSTAWIAAEFANLRSPATFYTVTAPESRDARP